MTRIEIDPNLCFHECPLHMESNGFHFCVIVERSIPPNWAEAPNWCPLWDDEILLTKENKSEDAE